MRIQALLLSVGFAVVGCAKKDKGDSKGEPGAGEDGPGGDDTSGPGAGTLAITATLPDSVDASTAIMLSVQGPTVAGFATAKSSPIAAGSLAISLNEAEQQQMGLLEDPTAAGGSDVANGILIMAVKEGDNKFDAGATMKFVEIPAAGDSDLVKLPTDLITDTNAVALGALSDENGSLVATTISGADIVKTDAKVLAELASTDNGLKLVRNAYMNGDKSQEKYLDVNPQYVFAGELSAFLTGDYVGIKTNSEDKNARLRGFNLRFEGRADALKPSDMCDPAENDPSSPKSTLKLIPPKVDLSGNAQTPELTFFSDQCEANASNCHSVDELTSRNAYLNGADRCTTNKDMTDNEAFDFEVQTRDGGKKYVNFNWGGGFGFKGAIPGGLWDMKLQTGSKEELIGRFDIGSAYPLSSLEADAYPVVYMPVLKITRGAGNKLTGFSLKFAVWNATTSAYEEVTDLTLFKSIVQDLSLRVEDHSTDGWANPDKDGVTVPIATPESGYEFTADLSKLDRDWKVLDGNVDIDNDESTPTASSFVVWYAMYGVTYRFDLRP